MKTVVFLLLILGVTNLYWGCEPENSEFVNEPVTITPRPSGSAHGNTPTPSDWSMVVLSVDSYLGGEANEFFIDILLGQPLASGIPTTHMNSFKLYPNSDKMELWLGFDGWTLWKANGLFPIIWEFKYSKTAHTMELEGFANMGLSNCDIPEGSTLVNRFYFVGGSTNAENGYSGRYVWSETYETGTCVRIEGEMIVYQPFM